MNINRHNYEEFFLMYVDNELSAAEKSAVDQFILENPDLAPELELLSQTSLPAESFSFSGKNNLIKPEPISAETQEEMLRMLDAELSNQQSLDLHNRIRSTPELQTEWNILQQTKLDPDETVVFPDKASLYKHSAGRVVTMRFLRIAVAAAVLAFGIFLGVKNIGHQNQEEPRMANQGNNPANRSNTNKQTKELDPGQEAREQEISNKEQLANNSHIPAISPEKKQEQADNGTGDRNAAPMNNDAQNLASLPGNQNKNNNPALSQQTARPDRNNEANDNTPFTANRGPEKKSLPESNFSNENNVQLINRALSPERNQPNLIADVRPEEKMKAIKPLSALDTDIMQPLTVSNARTAALNPDEEGDKNDILFLDESRVKKTKLSGMFRKLKRTIERKTNIKTGNGVKIAGFEIAVR